MRTNWAGSHAYRARGLATPGSVAELQELVARTGRIKALGSRHSFSDLADTDGLQVSLERLPRTIEVDGDVVRVPGGLRYGTLAVEMLTHRLALGNLASLPHISVAGAVATGTHGSGLANGSLATAVRAIELVTGTGELIRLRGADLAGAVVNVGVLGIVTSLDLAVEPSYDVTQVVHEGLTWPALLDRLEEILGAAYSVSVFTLWRDEEVGQVWVKSRGEAPEIPGAHPAGEQRHMISGMAIENTTPQLGIPGPWHERLPHFRMGFLPSAGEELQSEYLVPLSRAREALVAVRGLGEAMADALYVTELRTVAADDLWLSGAYGEDALAIHFTWRRDLALVGSLAARLEQRLLPLGARPHWGKVFAAGAGELAPLYPRWSDFLALARRLDPDGRFRNDWTGRHLGLAP
jgi:xylitol oxidase